MKRAGDQRTRELGRIHILAKQLQMSRSVYEAVLWAQQAGCESSKTLDEHGRRKVIAHLEALAKRAGIEQPKRRQKPAPGKAALVSKIRALLMDATPPRDDAYADGMARRMFGVERFTWLEWGDLVKLVAALSIDQKRRKAR